MTEEKKKNIKENLTTFATVGISATILLTLMILLSGAPQYDSYKMKELNQKQTNAIRQYKSETTTDSARILLRTEIENRNDTIAKLRKDSLAHADFCRLPLQKQFKHAINKQKQQIKQVKEYLLQKTK